MIVLGAVLAVSVILEGTSYLAIGVANLFLWSPIESRRALLERQSQGLQAMLESDSVGKAQLDPILGWHNRPGYADGGDAVNFAGLRSAREYELVGSDSLPRIAAFGDSFVYCDEVSNDACWTSLLENGWQVEALNYGVGGYGTDQAFLRYVAEGKRYRPSTVLIGFAPVDLLRVVNRYRPFLSPHDSPAFKPRFQLVGDRLSLLRTAVGAGADVRRLLAEPERIAEIGSGDYWYDEAVYEHRLYRLSATYRLMTSVWARLRRAFFDPDRLFQGRMFRPQSEAFRVQRRIMVAFADSVEAAGASPVFLFLPSREDVARSRAGLLPSYQPLSQRLADDDFRLIDPLEAFNRSGVPVGDFFAPGGHYSELGNRVVAEVVALDLRLRDR